MGLRLLSLVMMVWPKQSALMARAGIMGALLQTDAGKRAQCLQNYWAMMFKS